MSESDVSSIGPVIPMPALFINISILFSLSIIKLIVSSISSFEFILHLRRKNYEILYLLGFLQVP